MAAIKAPTTKSPAKPVPAKATPQPGNLRVWADVSDEEFADAQKEIDSFKTGEFWKPKAGENVIRVLPAVPGNPFKVIIYEHFVEGIPGREGMLRFVCPRFMTKGAERCPRCEEAETKAKSRNPMDRAASKDMRPQQRIYLNIIDRANPEHGAMVYAFGKGIWNDLNKIKDSPQNGGKYWNPDADGFDIVINKTGEKKETKYTVTPARKDSPLHEDDEQANAWIMAAKNLEQYAELMEPEALLDELNGGQRGGQRQARGGRDQAALPARAGKRPSRTAQDEVDDGGVINDDSDDAGSPVIDVEGTEVATDEEAPL